MENITSSTPTVLKDSENSHVGLQIAFSLIAATSFTFNLLFCVMLLRNPVMLKKAHNILLFNLADDLSTLSYKAQIFFSSGIS